MPEHIRRIVPVAILTMLRRGEILGLRDSDVDLETGSIAVFTQRQDGERVSTKTRAGRRTVDVGPRTLRSSASSSSPARRTPAATSSPRPREARSTATTSSAGSSSPPPARRECPS